MMKHLSVAALVCASFALFSAQKAHATEPVVITLGGNIDVSNRTSIGPDDVSLFRAHGAEFKKGYGFDREALAEIEQGSIEATIPGTEDEIGVFSGPLLESLAAHVGGNAKILAPLALDGYQLDISPLLIEEHSPILATHLNGAPLNLGDFGPAMVVFPDQSDPELDEDLNALEVWAVFYIEIR